MFLKKLGIDIEFYTLKTGTQNNKLIILNTYELKGGNQPILIFINTNIKKEYSYSFLLKEIIENAEKKFLISLENLIFISDKLKTSYIKKKATYLSVGSSHLRL